MPEDVNIVIALISAVSALVGGVVGAAVTLLATWLRNRSEERKHFRELLLSAALENWKEQVSIEKLKLEKRPTLDVYFPSLDMYLFYMVKLAPALLDKDIKPSDVEKLLDEANEISEKVWEYKKTRNLIQPIPDRSRPNDFA